MATIVKRNKVDFNGKVVNIGIDMHKTQEKGVCKAEAKIPLAAESKEGGKWFHVN